MCFVSRSTKLLTVITVFCKCVYVHSAVKLTSSGVEYEFAKAENSSSSKTFSDPTDSLNANKINLDDYTEDDSNPSDYEDVEFTTQYIPFDLALIGTEHQVCNGVRNPVNGSHDLLLNYLSDFVLLLGKLTEKVVHNESLGFALYKELEKRKGPRFFRAKFNMTILNDKYRWNVSTQIKFVNLFNKTKAIWANLTKYVTSTVNHTFK